jgi:serine/threonine-protein kinase
LLNPGTKVGPYEILSALGAGGMGEVYRARDTKLGRDVALKSLPQAFTNDPERMARFSREAQVLASLNNPNIAAIYGLEESAGTRALVMELVEGPTLAERIAKGPIPLEEALPIAKQIAEALEYAHERGIIHRDLKPANIKVTADGTVKVLDFGLAKALAEDSVSPDISNSPTISVAATKAGYILGTAAYMSPEQARGKAADRRADIWASGCVLYEMLAGKKAFAGETISDILAAVIRGEPDWSLLPAATPQGIRTVLRRSLEKDPRRRLQAIGEARFAVEEQISGAAAASESSVIGTREAPASAGLRVLPWALAGVLAAIAAGSVWGLWRAPRPASKAVTQFSVQLPSTQALKLDNEPALALSVDGSRLVYVATVDGQPQLMLRSLNHLDAVPIPGTTDGEGAFISPDGNWVGFFAEGKLKKASLNGGPVTNLADIAIGRGGTWGPDDTIVYSPDAAAGLIRIPATGGTPQPVSTLDPAKKERTHRWPQFLPGGKAVLFTVGTLDSPDYYDDGRIDAVVLATGERRTLLEGSSMGRYVPSGHLLFARGGVLFAVAFDADRLKVTGTPLPVLEGISGELTTGAAHFAAADNGTLAYVPGQVRGALAVLAWGDRNGTFEPLPLPPHSYLDPSLSADGNHLAVVIPAGKDEDIWIYDFARGTLSRLTFGGTNRGPRWSPDGKKIAYTVFAPDGKCDIYSKSADGSGAAEHILRSDTVHYVDSWSPDGKALVFTKTNARAIGEIWVLPLEGDRKARKITQSEFGEGNASISPDGHWLAYVSVESGRPQVFVRPFDGSAGKWQVSTEGALEPQWSSNGRELFYRNVLDNRMMAVPVETGAKFVAGTPRKLFDGVYNPRTVTDTLYGVAPDGQRFLMIRPATAETHSRQVNVVLNWFEELRNLTASGRK